MSGWKGLRGVWPAVVLCGGTFATVQFVVSNYLGPSLTDVLGGVASMCALTILLRFWRPRDVWRFSDESEEQLCTVRSCVAVSKILASRDRPRLGSVGGSVSMCVPMGHSTSSHASRRRQAGCSADDGDDRRRPAELVGTAYPLDWHHRAAMVSAVPEWGGAARGGYRRRRHQTKDRGVSLQLAQRHRHRHFRRRDFLGHLVGNYTLSIRSCLSCKPFIDSVSRCSQSRRCSRSPT